MILLSNIIVGIAMVLKAVINLYFWVVIIATLLTWVRPDPYNPIVRTLATLTEPVFYRVRKYLPFTYVGGLDLSPVIVLLGLQLAEIVVVQTLFQWAALM